MSKKPTEICPKCRQQMMETEFGPMCRRALKSWKRVDDHWRRSFGGHPETNPDEVEYLEKYGMPEGIL
jgi:hypothetical protein